MTTETQTETRRWTRSDAGPIQTNRVNKALSHFRSMAGSEIVLSGVKGRTEGLYAESQSRTYLVMGPVTASNYDELRQEICERFDWSVSKANANAIAKAIEEATEKLDIPVKDERRTEEEHAEWERELAEARAKNDAERAARDAEAAQATSDEWTVEKRRHTKRGEDFYGVVLAERVERDVFERLRRSAKAAGGWYCRAWAGQSGCFGFASEEDARTWASRNI
jgi:hypothetical protein